MSRVRRHRDPEERQALLGCARWCVQLSEYVLLLPVKCERRVTSSPIICAATTATYQTRRWLSEVPPVATNQCHLSVGGWYSLHARDSGYSWCVRCLPSSLSPTAPRPEHQHPSPLSALPTGTAGCGCRSARARWRCCPVRLAHGGLGRYCSLWDFRVPSAAGSERRRRQCPRCPLAPPPPSAAYMRQ